MHPDEHGCGCCSTSAPIKPAFNPYPLPDMCRTATEVRSNSPCVTRYGVFEALEEVNEVLSRLAGQAREHIHHSRRVGDNVPPPCEGEEEGPVKFNNIMDGLAHLNRKARLINELLAISIENNRTFL